MRSYKTVCRQQDYRHENSRLVENDKTDPYYFTDKQFYNI